MTPPARVIDGIPWRTRDGIQSQHLPLERGAIGTGLAWGCDHRNHGTPTTTIKGEYPMETGSAWTALRIGANDDSLSWMRRSPSEQTPGDSNRSGDLPGVPRPILEVG